MDAGQLQRQQFAGLKQVPQIRLGVVVAYFTVDAVVEGRKVFFPLLIVDVDDPFAGKQHGISAIAGGHHTIKHIYPKTNVFQNVPGCAHAHEVAGLLRRQVCATPLANVVHHLLGFAHAEAANGVAGGVHAGRYLAALLAQVFKRAALHNGEQVLGVAVQGIGGIKLGKTTLQPPKRQRHAFFGVGVIAAAGRAFVEGHDDIGADAPLNLNDALGRKQVLAAVDMALKGDALFINFSGAGQAKHLITTAIGKYGPLPAVEPVQATGGLQHLQTRPQVQVIGVAQNNLCLHICHQLLLRHGFYRAHGTHRHKNGRQNLAVVGGNFTRPRLAVGIGVLQLKC